LVARVLIRLPVTISASSSCGLGTDMDWQEKRVSINCMLSPFIQPHTKWLSTEIASSLTNYDVYIRTSVLDTHSSTCCPLAVATVEHEIGHSLWFGQWEWMTSCAQYFRTYPPPPTLRAPQPSWSVVRELTVTTSFGSSQLHGLSLKFI